MRRGWLLIVGLVAGCASVENRLLFHPLPAPQARRGVEDLDLRLPDGSTIHAQWHPCVSTTGALLYCHGNAGNLEQRGELVRQLRDGLQRSVLIFDYPGYGSSAGQPSEAGCYAAADAAYDWLVQAQQIDPAEIVLFGKSLGGGVATDLAVRRPHQALVLVKTFTSVPDIAQEQLPLLPTRWLVQNRFDNLRKISRCPGPVFIAQGGRDRLIPTPHGQRLYAEAPEPKRFLLLQDSDHNDPLPPEFFSSLDRFLRAIK